MIAFERLQKKDMLIVCENSRHDFFVELNMGNQIGEIHQSPANILEDVGIAVTHLYEDEDVSFPNVVYIDIDPAGRAEVTMEAIFKLKNLGTKDGKVVLSYIFTGVLFDGDHYTCEFSEEISEIMITMVKAGI